MDSIYFAAQVVIGLGLLLFSMEQIRKSTKSLYLYFFSPKTEISEGNIDLIRKRARGEKMVERAKAIGPVVVENTQNGMMAVTPWQSFRLALYDVVKEWELSVKEKDWVKAIAPYQVLPTETFVFADDHLFTRVYTSKMSGAKEILDVIVHQVTGVMRSEVDAKSFEVAVNCLVEKDKRLVIPFLDPSVRKDQDRLNDMVKRFGFRDQNDVIAAILEKVKK